MLSFDMGMRVGMWRWVDPSCGVTDWVARVEDVEEGVMVMELVTLFVAGLVDRLVFGDLSTVPVVTSLFSVPTFKGLTVMTGVPSEELPGFRLN